MWGTIQVGRLSLSEVHRMSEQVNAGTGERTISLDGREFTYRFGAVDSIEAIARRAEDFSGLADMYVPVIFSAKTEHNGYYQVNDANATITKWNDAGQQFFDWSLILRKIGPDNAVDIESRLGSVARQNSFLITGERWHAPPIGHYGYTTGATLPASNFTRNSEQGAIRVYRDIPAGSNPRYGVAVADYLKGRVRILLDGAERNGSGIRFSATGWELNNGLVRVRPLTSGGMLQVSAWGGSAWESVKAWNIAKGAATTPLGVFDSATVVRNDLEIGTIRLVKNDAPGRTLVDLTLRRGSRFVEVYVQTITSTILGVYLETSETTTSQITAGYIFATADDADGNRYTSGTTRPATYTTDRGFARSATTVFDAYLGVVFNGGSAVQGDTAGFVRNQYVGSLSESTVMVRR